MLREPTVSQYCPDGKQVAGSVNTSSLQMFRDLSDEREGSCVAPEGKNQERFPETGGGQLSLRGTVRTANS
jgi:hypothetical protein